MNIIFISFNGDLKLFKVGAQNLSQTEQRMCAACSNPITDKYLLQVSGRSWHARCLRCCVCQLALDRQPSCFIKDESIYCKTDYAKWVLFSLSTFSKFYVRYYVIYVLSQKGISNVFALFGLLWADYYVSSTSSGSLRGFHNLGQATISKYWPCFKNLGLHKRSWTVTVSNIKIICFFILSQLSPLLVGTCISKHVR